jgi:chromosome segregation ATPase
MDINSANHSQSSFEISSKALELVNETIKNLGNLSNNTNINFQSLLTEINKGFNNVITNLTGVINLKADDVKETIIKRFDFVDTKINDISVSIDSKHKIIDKLLNDIFTQISSLYSSQQLVHKEIKKVSKKINITDETIAALSNAVLEVDTSVEILKSTITTLQTASTTANKTIIGLTSRVDEVNNAIHSTKEAVNVVKQDHQNIENYLNQQKIELAGINSFMTIINSNVNSIHPKILKIFDKFNLLNGTVNGLKLNISDLAKMTIESKQVLINEINLTENEYKAILDELWLLSSCIVFDGTLTSYSKWNTVPEDMVWNNIHENISWDMLPDIEKEQLNMLSTWREIDDKLKLSEIQ